MYIFNSSLKETCSYQHYNSVRTEVLMVVNIRIIVSWDMMLWRGTIVLGKRAAPIFRVEDGDSRLL
jgi:hypothetical protein